MKSLNTYIAESRFFKNVGADRIVVNTIDELRQLIKKTINELGKDCDLNFIDVSKINDMSYLPDLNLLVIFLNGIPRM